MLPEHADSKPFDLTSIGPFTEDEMTAMARSILGKIDTDIKSSGPAPKRPFIDCFGTQKAYKTAVTVEMEKFFRRNKFKTYCPPESAEHEDIRADIADNPIIYQAKHLTVVMDQYLNLIRNRDYHLSVVSRNLNDMPYWYEKGILKGTYSIKHATSAKEWIYELLRQGGTDVALFFTCSVEAAMKREYGQSVTQKRGSKMNEKDVAEGLEIYERTMRELQINVPNLPTFRIDTSSMTVKEATEEALRYILPTICIRYEIPDYSFMPYALSLVQRRAQFSGRFEEQIKLSGHPNLETIYRMGWVLSKDSHQEDIYLDMTPDSLINPQGEILRLRYEDGTCKFMYKGQAQDSLLSHRRPHSFLVDTDEAVNILASYKPVVTINKHRLNFRKNGSADDGHFFTLHVDTLDGLGNFTEIRARGTKTKDHTRELLALAEHLGFSTGSIINRNYLSLALER